jgi:hypothetical protein
MKLRAVLISLLIQRVLHRKQGDDYCVHVYIAMVLALPVIQTLTGIQTGQKLEQLLLGNVMVM